MAASTMEHRIVMVDGVRVMLDRDLASLYGVTTAALNQAVARNINIAIMRAFVRLRELVSTHRDLAARIDELEEKYDGKFAVVFDAMRKLLDGDIAQRGRPRIGFTLQQERRTLRARSLEKFRSR